MRRIIPFCLIFAIIFPLFNSCGKKVSEEDLYAQAQEYEKKEDFKMAIRTYEKLARSFPTGKRGAEALFKAAIIYANNLKDLKKSIEMHQKVVENYPKSNYAPQAQFMIGFLYANEIKDYEKAREAYNLFLRRYPNHELVASVKWELENMGKDINEIDFLSETPRAEKKAKGGQ